MLVDTGVLLWWLQDDERITGPARSFLANGDIDAWVSAASFWEISIMAASGKLRVDGDVLAAARESGFQVLPIDAEDGVAAGQLPLHHRDPFDRMLVAQALRRSLRILTSDAGFTRYGVPVLRV